MTADLKAALERLLETAGHQLEKANQLVAESNLDAEGPLANSIQALMAALTMTRSEKLNQHQQINQQ